MNKITILKTLALTSLMSYQCLRYAFGHSYERVLFVILKRQILRNAESILIFSFIYIYILRNLLKIFLTK